MQSAVGVCVKAVRHQNVRTAIPGTTLEEKARVAPAANTLLAMKPNKTGGLRLGRPPQMLLSLKRLFTLVLISAMFFAFADPVAAMRFGESKNAHAINKMKRSLRADGKLSKTDKAFLALANKLARAGVDIFDLAADERSFINFLLDGILFGSIDAAAIAQFERLADELIADGSLDEDDIVILSLVSVIIQNEGEITTPGASLYEVLKKLAAAGLDLPADAASSPSLVSLLFGLVTGVNAVTLPTELCDLIDELAEDGSLDSNDLFVITMFAATLENTDGGVNAANRSLVVVLRKLADAGVDLTAFTRAHPSLVSSLFSLVNRVPPIPIPKEFCDLVEELAEDGTLESNDLFILTMFAATFDNTDGQPNDATRSLVVVLRKLAAAGLDLAAFTEARAALVAALFRLVNLVPPVPIPKEFCDLIDELAADGSLSEDDLFILTLYAIAIDNDQGATAGNGSLVHVLRKLDSFGVDLAGLDPSLANALLNFVFAGGTIPQEFCDLILALAFDDGTLSSNDLIALSIVARLLVDTGEVSDQAVVLAEIVALLGANGIDAVDVLSEPGNFLVALAEALQGADLSLEEIQGIQSALELFLLDGHLDPFEKEILASMVEEARM